MRRLLRSERGNSLIEFTLVGIPMIFILISTFEISRGMWMYTTLAHAVKEGTKYATVHGKGCTEGLNNCASTVATIAGAIQYAGVGLLPDQLTVTMASPTRTIGPRTLGALLADTTTFPAYMKGVTPQDSGGDPDSGARITITATYPFQSAIAMFWPGSSPVVFGTIPIWASSQARVEF